MKSYVTVSTWKLISVQQFHYTNHLYYVFTNTGCPSWVSLVLSLLLSYRAADGYLETGVFATHGCTHTQETPTPWWTVDLQGFYYISSVTITNRHGTHSK